MANQITNVKHGDESLDMSNSHTCVFLSMLALSGSALATTEREKDLVIWLASRNELVIGTGCVGFDVSDLPWSHDFDNEKQFMLRITEAAISKLHWDELPARPTYEDPFVEEFVKFRMFINALGKEDVDPVASSDGRVGYGNPQYLRCPQHGVYLVIWQPDGEPGVNSCIVCSTYDGGYPTYY